MNKPISTLVFCGFVLSTSSAQEPLTFLLNATTSRMGPYNATANQAATLDVKSGIACLYNGNTGAAMCTHYETGCSVYIPGGSSDQTWSSSKESYEDYFSNWPSLEKFFELGEETGISFNAPSITGKISEKIAEILTPLSLEYSSPFFAFSTYIYISQISSNVLKTSLDGLADVVGNVKTPIRGDFKWLIEVLQGMGSFFSDVKGGMSLLKKSNVSLDLAKILTEPTGMHVVIYLLKQLSPALNIQENFGNSLNNEEKFFSTVDQLGGGLCYGLDGFAHVLSKIVCFLNGQGSMHNIIIILNEFYHNSKTHIPDIRKKGPAAVNDLQDAIKSLKLTDDLDGLTNLLTSIQDEGWTVNGVNMSQVINTLFEIDSCNDIDAIAKVITLLNKCELQEYRHRIGETPKSVK